MFLVDKEYEYKGFKTHFSYEPESNLFVGCIDNVEDSVNFYGYTVIEAYQMFIQAVENYISFCKEVGKGFDKMGN